MKFIHAADIHLDSPLVGLERYDGAPVEALRGATRRALENLVRLALAEKVDFVLIAGDVYDGDWKDYNTGLFFSQQMSRLREAGVRVFLIRGNHDAASQVTRELSLPQNVTQFSWKKPETVCIEELQVAIHGQGFKQREVRDDLSADYPLALPGYLNIGLLHTSAGGREGHENYAPCRVDGLTTKGYDYWALGHVHKAEVLCEAPWIVFPGNLQGRHARECGAKGCTLVTVEDLRVQRVDPMPLDVLRWQVCDVSVTGAVTVDDVVVRVRTELGNALDAAEDRDLAVRVRLVGITSLHRQITAAPEQVMNEVRAAATDLSSGRIWVEKVQIGTLPSLDAGTEGGEGGPVGQLLAHLRELTHDQAKARELLGVLSDLRAKLPAKLLRGSDDLRLDFDDPALVQTRVGEIEQLLLARLFAQKGGDR
jgi:DNA repair exonuclease SbcCD nuclease subunit